MKRQVGAVVAGEEIWPVMLSGISAAALLFPPAVERLQYTFLDNLHIVVHPLYPPYELVAYWFDA